MKTNFMVVNGIMTDADSVDGWTDLFEDFYQNMDYPCTKYEYTCGPIKSLFQGKRVKDICKVLNRITNPLVYVGHSNGCDLFNKVVNASNIQFVSAHLFAGAMEADFNKNGMNSALVNRRVENLYIYCSTKDRALKNWASKTSFLSFIGMGYGTLGYTGPKNVLKEVEDRVHMTWENEYDHSDWFIDANINKSFALTLRK